MPQTGLFDAHVRQIADQTIRHRVPATHPTHLFVEVGGLIGYERDMFALGFDDIFRRATAFVGKILSRAKPADLPMEQSVKFELAVSLKTARALNLTIPPSLLLRADELIE